jgi:hypothetical protein
MRVPFKPFDRFAAHPARGAVGVYNPRRFFYLFQLVVQRVVFLVGYSRVVQHVVFVRPFIENIDKFSLSVFYDI